MFQSDDKKNQIENFSHDTPVHSMQKDLDEIENPKKYPPATGESMPAAERPAAGAPVSRINLSETQRTSPFLSQKPEPAVEALRKEVQAAKAEQRDEVIQGSAEDRPQGSSLGKIFTIIALLLILIFAGVGGYYFWTTRGNDNSAPVLESPAPITDTNPVAQAPVEEAPAETPAPAVSRFSTDKPNYFPVDIQAATPDTIKSSFAKYASDIEAEEIAGTLEFLVTDGQNNPVSFNVFAEKSSLLFSKELLGKLDSNFSLIFNNDNGKYRIGLAIDIKDKTGLKDILLKEEPNLPDEIKPIFLASQYTVEKGKLFNTNASGQPEVRYVNITSPEDLSVDYAIGSISQTSGDTLITKDALFIGTTQATLKALLDYYQLPK